MTLSTNPLASPYRDSEACPDCDGLLVDSECPACDEEEKQMSDVDRFYAHIGGCVNCHGAAEFRLCNYGVELMFEAGENLDDCWHEAMRYYHEQAIRQKEADANFAFYARQEEF